MGGGLTAVHGEASCTSGTLNSGTTNVLAGVWGSSSSDEYVAGDNGALLHFNGTDWSAMPTGMTNNLIIVSCSSGNVVLAAGDFHSILHYDGNAWTDTSRGAND